VSERLLVTGAGGQLGLDVLEQAALRSIDALGLGHAELDITDAARVHDIVTAHRPTAIVHCAAWTAVDEAEAHPDAALAVNGQGSANVVAAAHEVGAYVVTISTDYVFDGTNGAGYEEEDVPAPINSYGASKLAAERATLALDGACVARTAWLFGREGTNFVRTIARLARERDAIDVVTDQVGSPTYSDHLARALLDLVAARTAGIVHVAGSPPATWHEIATEVVTALGAPCEVRPTTSDAFPRPARRPACSILRTTRPDTPHVGDWREGVREVLASLHADQPG
jgi:dTDP-4-dehydrorhamnose reductase